MTDDDYKYFYEPHKYFFCPSLEQKNKAASNDFNTRVVECRLAAKVLARQLLEGDSWRDLVKLRDVQVRGLYYHYFLMIICQNTAN